jgi:transcription antitermination factor NusG
LFITNDIIEEIAETSSFNMESADVWGKAWYVAHTRSRHEVKIQQILACKGIETFLPRIEVPSRRIDRQASFLTPLFPGYIFLHIHAQPEILREIIICPGVVRILGTSEGITPLPSEVMESIKTLLASGLYVNSHTYLDRGMRVRIMDGPLAGATGILQRVQGRKRRLVVVVELMQRAVMVELEDETVEPIS